VGHEVTRLVTAEDDHSEVGVVLDASDEDAELVDGVRVQQVDRAVIEGHSPIGRRDFIDVELLCRAHDPDRIHR
jgi:hypothetical protein